MGEEELSRKETHSIKTVPCTFRTGSRRRQDVWLNCWKVSC